MHVARPQLATRMGTAGMTAWIIALAFFQSICIRTHNSQTMHPDCQNVFEGVAGLLRLLPEFYQLIPIRLQEAMFECVEVLHPWEGGVFVAVGRNGSCKARIECHQLLVRKHTIREQVLAYTGSHRDIHTAKLRQS